MRLLRLGKGFVEGQGRGRVALHGIVGKGKAFDFVHAVGALLVDFDIPGNQIGLVAMRRDAQGSMRRSRGRVSSIER